MMNEQIEFKKYFPEYKDKKVMRSVAGIVIDEGVDTYAFRKRLFVIGQSGETVHLLDEKYEPRTW